MRLSFSACDAKLPCAGAWLNLVCAMPAVSVCISTAPARCAIQLAGHDRCVTSEGQQGSCVSTHQWNHRPHGSCVEPSHFTCGLITEVGSPLPQFIMIGSGNPSEGELRPQLLDRFGLSVNVATLQDMEQRVALVLDRLDYDKVCQTKNPIWFCASEGQVSGPSVLIAMLQDMEQQRVALVLDCLDQCPRNFG